MKTEWLRCTNSPPPLDRRLLITDGKEANISTLTRARYSGIDSIDAIPEGVGYCECPIEFTAITHWMLAPELP